MKKFYILHLITNLDIHLLDITYIHNTRVENVFELIFPCPLNFKQVFICKCELVLKIGTKANYIDCRLLQSILKQRKCLIGLRWLRGFWSYFTWQCNLAIGQVFLYPYKTFIFLTQTTWYLYNILYLKYLNFI